MQTFETSILEKQHQLVEVLNTSTENELSTILENPTQLLTKLGFEINDNFLNEIKSSFHHSAINLMAKKNATLPIKKGRSRAVANQDGIHFSVQPWGLVLELDENATQKVIAGINIAAGVLTAAAAVSSTFAAPVAVVAGVYSGFLAVSAGVIGLVDQGNGIYLTLTWPQIAFIAFALPIPIPTPR